MADGTASLAQDDLHLAETEEDVASIAVKAAVKDIHTCMPGIIKSFDPSKQTATVQPAIQRNFLGIGLVDLPLCRDVPVVFPAGGELVMTFPVTAGDECLLMFAERAIDNWWDRGGVQAPSEVRFHDLSDGFAYVGISSRPRFLSPGVATDATEVRTRDGATKISVKGGQVTVIATNVNVQADHAVVASPNIDLGASGLAAPAAGVVVGAGIDSFTGATYFALGSASTIVKAKKS